MKLIHAALISSFIVMSGPGMLSAQSSAKILGKAGKVEVFRAGQWTESTSDVVSAGERLRTGVGSSAAIELGPGKLVSLNALTEVELSDLNGSPAIRLESGDMRITSEADIRFWTRDTQFENVDKPLDVDVAYQNDFLNLTVVVGGLRSGSMAIWGPQDSKSRKYVADSTELRNPNAAATGNVYISPYVMLGNRGAKPAQPNSAPASSPVPVNLPQKTAGH